MPKLKYLKLFVITGTTIIVIGGIIGVKALSKKEGANSWIASISMMLGGSALQAAAIGLFFKHQIDEEIDSHLRQRLQAIPKACRGCRNFHGMEYSGVQLVCAIHPYGVEGDTCCDYEKFSHPNS